MIVLPGYEPRLDGLQRQMDRFTLDFFTCIKSIEKLFGKISTATGVGCDGSNVTISNLPIPTNHLSVVTPGVEKNADADSHIKLTDIKEFQKLSHVQELLSLMIFRVAESFESPLNFTTLLLGRTLSNPSVMKYLHSI